MTDSSNSSSTRYPTDGYGTKYPYNRVTVQYPSGSEVQWDATPGKERYRWCHLPSGTNKEIKPDGTTVEKHTGNYVRYCKGGETSTVGGENSGGGGGSSEQGHNSPNKWGREGGGNTDRAGDGGVRETYGGAHSKNLGQKGGNHVTIGGNQTTVVGGHSAHAVAGDSSHGTVGKMTHMAGGDHQFHAAGKRIVVANKGKVGKYGPASLAKDEAIYGASATKISTQHTLNIGADTDKSVGGNETKNVGKNSTHNSKGNHSEKAGGTHSTSGKDVNHSASGGMAMQAGQAISMLSKLFSMGSGSGGGGGGGGGGAGSGGGAISANDSGIGISHGNNSVQTNTAQTTVTGNLVTANVIVNGTTTLNGSLTVNGTTTVANLVSNGTVAFQAYDLQSSLANNFFYTVPSTVYLAVFNISAGFGKGTITMPASPIDGQRIEFTCSNSIATLVINANSGQAVFGAPTAMNSNTPFRYAWVNSLATWFRV